MVLKTNLCIFLVKPVFFLSQKLTHVKSIHKGIMQIYLGIEIDWALSIGPLSVTDRTKFGFGVSRWHSFEYHGGMEAEVFLKVQLKQLKKQAISCCPRTVGYSKVPSRKWKPQPGKATSLAAPSAAAQSDFADFALELISSPSPFTWLS